MKRALSGSRWLEWLGRPVLVAAMMTCLAVPLVQIVAAVVPGWQGAAVLAVVFAACLEGVLSERVLRARGIRGGEYLLSRAAELLLLLLALKLASYANLGLAALWADLQRGLRAPGEILTLADLVLSGLLAGLWSASLHVSRLARELDEDPGRGPPPPDKTSAAYYLWLTGPPPARDREAALQQLGGAFVWGGAGVLVGAGLAQYVAPGRSSALPVLLYFALGLALLSQARWSVARSMWQIEGASVAPDVGRRWLVWSALFLLGVTLLAWLLPTAYGTGPLRLLVGLLALAAQWVMYGVMLLFYLLSLPLALLFPGLRDVNEPDAPKLSLPEAATPVEAATPAWVRTAGLVLFWALAAVAVGYALFRFYRDRFGYGVEGPAWERSWWRRWLAWLRRTWRRWRMRRAWAMARRAAAPEAQPGAPSGILRWLSARRLAPGERVRFYYLSTVRRAAQAGQPRSPDQTPYEYQAALDRRFSELEPDLDGLTQAFVGARYRPGPVLEAEARAAEPFWRRLQALLRRRRAGRDATQHAAPGTPGIGI